MIRWGFLRWAHGDLCPPLGSIAMHRKLPRRSRRAARLPAPTQAKGPRVSFAARRNGQVFGGFARCVFPNIGMWCFVFRVQGNQREPKQKRLSIPGSIQIGKWTNHKQRSVVESCELPACNICGIDRWAKMSLGRSVEKCTASKQAWADKMNRAAPIAFLSKHPNHLSLLPSLQQMEGEGHDCWKAGSTPMAFLVSTPNQSEMDAPNK